jgi:hypothetical protein
MIQPAPELAGSRVLGSTSCRARAQDGSAHAELAGTTGINPIRGAAVMSELDVIVIHIRAEQAAEYERLFAERELPRWREYKARGAFISARISRAAFGTDQRQDVAKYVIAVEVPSHAEHSQHDADPGFQEFNRLADALQPENPLVYGGEVLHAV